jgi:hypothetical protein
MKQIKERTVGLIMLALIVSTVLIGAAGLAIAIGFYMWSIK